MGEVDWVLEDKFHNRVSNFADGVMATKW